MTEFRRVGRTIIATGGVSTPCLERLSNGDLLASYRRLQPPETGLQGLRGWNGEVIRSRDGGRTWSEPIFTTMPQRPDDPPGFRPYHGMVQLPDGTILLPCMGADGGVFLARSEDNGESWSGPDPVGHDLEDIDWLGIGPYGKIRLLSDGILLMPVWGRFRGHQYDLTAHLRSSDGGRTWDDFVVVARGHVAYNETIELPDGRLMAMIARQDSPTGHGLTPFYWSWSEDLGRTWSEPEVANYAIYGSSPSLFMTKRGTLLCAYRWVGDIDQGFVGTGFSVYSAEDGWNGVWGRGTQIVQLGRGILDTYPGRSFAGYPSFAYVDDERILCAYYMSWMGGGGSETQDIEGVYYVEAD